MPSVTMTVEEYLDLVEKAARGGKQVARGVRKVGRAVRQARKGKKDPKMASALKKARSGKNDPKMARALKKANAWGRTKSGKLRKGVSQAKIMKKAHALRRKM